MNARNYSRNLKTIDYKSRAEQTRKIIELTNRILNTNYREA